jgi:hypothetical protein
MTTQAQPDASWAALADLNDEQRQEAMLARFRILEDASEGDRASELAAMVAAEDAMTEDGIYPFTLSQLRAWALLSQEDLPKAQAIANGYEQVYVSLTGTAAWRRATVVQTIARLDLSAEEVDAIAELVPSLTRQIPRAHTNILEVGADEAEATRARHATAPLWKKLIGRG